VVFAELIEYFPAQVVRESFDQFVQLLAFNDFKIQSASYERLIKFVAEEGFPAKNEPANSG
jgi:hypothetical protein